MNRRLSLRAIADHLDAVLNAVPGTVTVRTALERSYLSDYGKVFPAVWVCGQRLQPLDDGRGLSQIYRQHVRNDIVVRVVVQRYADGVVDPEVELSALHDAVADSPSKKKIELLMVEGENFRTVVLDYADGPRYLELLRDPSRPDRLAEILKPLDVPAKKP